MSIQNLRSFFRQIDNLNQNPIKIANIEYSIQLFSSTDFFKVDQKLNYYLKNRTINSFQVNDVLIEVLNGRYGPYIKSGKKNYKIPKDLDPKKLTQEDCLNLIEKSTKK